MLPSAASTLPSVEAATFVRFLTFLTFIYWVLSLSHLFTLRFQPFSYFAVAFFLYKLVRFSYYLSLPLPDEACWETWLILMCVVLPSVFL